MKKYLALLLLIVITVLSAACSPRIQSVTAWPDQLVYAGTYLADIPMPTELEVTLSNGTTGKDAVTWDIAAWQGKSLQESITVTGQVEGARQPTKLQVLVLSKTATLPALTDQELATVEPATLMAERIAADRRITGDTWSSNRTAVAFTLWEEGPLYIWSVGQPAPQEVLPVNFYHELA